MNNQNDNNNQHNNNHPTPLIHCQWCGDLMAIRADHVPTCTRCRRLMALRQDVRDVVLTDWPNGVSHAKMAQTYCHRSWTLDLDDVLRPFWRACADGPDEDGESDGSNGVAA